MVATQRCSASPPLFPVYYPEGLVRESGGFSRLLTNASYSLKAFVCCRKALLILNHREHASTARGVISPFSGFRAESGILILEEKPSLLFNCPQTSDFWFRIFRNLHSVLCQPTIPCPMTGLEKTTVICINRCIYGSHDVVRGLEEER